MLALRRLLEWSDLLASSVAGASRCDSYQQQCLLALGGMLLLYVWAACVLPDDLAVLPMVVSSLAEVAQCANHQVLGQHVGL
jgi:hypothetical protein